MSRPIPTHSATGEWEKLIQAAKASSSSSSPSSPTVPSPSQTLRRRVGYQPKPLQLKGTEHTPTAAATSKTNSGASSPQPQSPSPHVTSLTPSPSAQPTTSYRAFFTDPPPEKSSRQPQQHEQLPPYKYSAVYNPPLITPPPSMTSAGRTMNFTSPISSSSARRPYSFTSSPSVNSPRPHRSPNSASTATGDVKPTSTLLHGLSFALSALIRLANGESELDLLRTKLHTLPCIRPVTEEGVNYPGYQPANGHDDTLVRGGFKPGSWISAQLAATSTMFQTKLHTKHHAFASLPAEAGGTAVFVPNTFLLWLLFTNLDTSGKGYVSVEDYAFFLAKHCRPESTSEHDPHNHSAQLKMEDYLDTSHNQDDVDAASKIVSGQQQPSSHFHASPYYPHSPFYHPPSPAKQPLHAPTLGLASLAQAKSYLSQTASSSPARPSSLHQPRMPSSEDILAVFRKHDRASCGRLGFAHFCRAFVPLAPGRMVLDEFEASLAELPKEFSTYLEPASDSGVTSPAGHQRQQTWSAMQPVEAGSGLLRKLTVDQEEGLLQLLLQEISLETQLNWDAVQLDELGSGKMRPNKQHGKFGQIQPYETFDLIDLYEYLDADMDGFLSLAELDSSYRKFHLTADPRELAYIQYRLDRDNDSKMLYMDLAEVFMPYAKMRSYSMDDNEQSARSRYVDPFQPFPWSEEIQKVMDQNLLERLLNPPHHTLTQEERDALQDEKETKEQIARQKQRADELQRRLKEGEMRNKQKQPGSTSESTSVNSSFVEEEAKESMSPLQQFRHQQQQRIPTTEKKRVSFGGIAGPFSPQPFEHQQQQQQSMSSSNYATFSSSTIDHPQSVHLNSPPPSSSSLNPALFFRPPPLPPGTSTDGSLNVDQLVSDMTPSDLQHDLPKTYPFMLQKALSPGSIQLPNGQVIQGAGVTSPSPKKGPRTMTQIRAEQVQAHQIFSQQVAAGQARAQEAIQQSPSSFNTSGPLSVTSPISRPGSASGLHAIKSPRIHVHVTSPSSRPMVASPSKSYNTTYGGGGAIDVDIYAPADNSGFEQKTNDTPINNSTRPILSFPTPLHRQPISVPLVQPLHSPSSTPSAATSSLIYSRPPPSASLTSSFSNAIHTPSNSHIPVVPSPAQPSARFAPSYPLRFPSETLAHSVHQTLYFPVPLGVPSAMLPLKDSGALGEKLTTEISQTALVASLASTQQRAKEMKAEEERKHQAEIDRLKRQQQQIAQAMANAVALTNAAARALPVAIAANNNNGTAIASNAVPTSSVSAPPVMSVNGYRLATQSIIPMNHQNTLSNYGPNIPSTVSAPPVNTSAQIQAIMEKTLATNSTTSTNVNQRVFSRPVTSASIHTATYATTSTPLVNFDQQQQLQQVALNTIHHHNQVLHDQDAAAREKEIEQIKQQSQSQLNQHQSELQHLQSTHAQLHQHEREKERRIRSGGGGNESLLSQTNSNATAATTTTTTIPKRPSSTDVTPAEPEVGSNSSTLSSVAPTPTDSPKNASTSVGDSFSHARITVTAPSPAPTTRQTAATALGTPHAVPPLLDVHDLATPTPAVNRTVSMLTTPFGGAHFSAMKRGNATIAASHAIGMSPGRPVHPASNTTKGRSLTFHPSTIAGGSVGSPFSGRNLTQSLEESKD